MLEEKIFNNRGGKHMAVQTIQETTNKKLVKKIRGDLVKIYNELGDKLNNIDIKLKEILKDL